MSGSSRTGCRSFDGYTRVSRRSTRGIERLVDRLLANPQFGERWARHWLDLVGYADQIGTSNSVFAEHAWRYRDYVIDAYNNDLPFDQFIREQIAGDLLNYDSIERRAAGIVSTGFLVLGDLEIVEADKAKMARKRFELETRCFK